MSLSFLLLFGLLYLRPFKDLSVHLDRFLKPFIEIRCRWSSFTYKVLLRGVSGFSFFFFGFACLFFWGYKSRNYLRLDVAWVNTRSCTTENDDKKVLRKDLLFYLSL